MIRLNSEFENRRDSHKSNQARGKFVTRFTAILVQVEERCTVITLNAKFGRYSAPQKV